MVHKRETTLAALTEEPPYPLNPVPQTRTPLQHCGAPGSRRRSRFPRWTWEEGGGLGLGEGATTARVAQLRGRPLFSLSDMHLQTNPMPS